MAGTGPIPKARRQRERDTNRRDRDVVTVVPDDVVRGPELPAGHTYSPTTVQWYETWRRSPQAQVFEATDWLALGLVLPLVNSHTRRPSAAAASEIRLVTASLGGTHADRLRMAKLRIDRSAEPADTSPGSIGSNVTPISARRDSIRARLAADPEPAAPTATDSAPGLVAETPPF